MASVVARFVTKKLLKETAQNRFGFEDPYFENVPATRIDGKPQKVRRRRKAAPPGLSDHDVQVLTKVKRRAYRLDSSFSICGFRWGLSSMIGIVPFVGDALDVLLAIMVARTCNQIEGGLPVDIQVRMFITIIIDFVIGLVPFAGDVGDAIYKANTINAARLEDYLRKKGQKALSNNGVAPPAIDPSDPAEFEKFQAQGPAELNLDPDHGEQSTGTIWTTADTAGTGTSTNPHPPPQSQPQTISPQAQSANTPSQPQPARGGFFNFGRKSRQPVRDIETG